MLNSWAKRLTRYYNETPNLGQFIALSLFVLHGLLDATTTAIAFKLSSRRGITNESIELNPLIPSNIIHMVLVNLIGASIIFVLVIMIFRTVRFRTEYSVKTVAYPLILVVLFGIFVVLNNIIAIIRLL
jgi:hypothetical protein